MTRILIIDDQQDILRQLQQLFEREGHEVDCATGGGSAQRFLDRNDYEVVFSDLRLRYPHDGLELLAYIKRRSPRTQVVIMTAFSSVESSVLALKGGAYDYITKPFVSEEVLLLAARAAEKARSAEGSSSPARGGHLSAPTDSSEIIGSSSAMVRLMRIVGQVARTEATVLITGESGTGKELVANALHTLSPRVRQPFIPVNCGAIPENLQESEFFGHARGAFTGAVKTKQGLFERADRGTLFLDEVGEMALTTQVKLLRFLQSGEVRKVGEARTQRVDVRLVAATNRDLLDLIAEKVFREDLYYRLNIISIEMPPLRERDGDIPLLADYFLRMHAGKLRSPVRSFSSEAMKRLNSYHWPGNVRELGNAIERAVTLCRGRRLELGDLPRLDRSPTIRGSRSDLPVVISYAAVSSNSGGGTSAALQTLEDPGGLDGFPSLKDMERRHIALALVTFSGNRTRASRALGISKSTLWRKIKEYKLSDEHP